MSRSPSDNQDKRHPLVDSDARDTLNYLSRRHLHRLLFLLSWWWWWCYSHPTQPTTRRHHSSSDIGPGDHASAACDSVDTLAASSTSAWCSGSRRTLNIGDTSARSWALLNQGVICNIYPCRYTIIHSTYTPQFPSIQTKHKNVLCRFSILYLSLSLNKSTVVKFTICELH